MTQRTSGKGKRGGRSGGPRAQSETIGVVLLVLVTIVASVGLVVVGSSAIGASQDTANTAFVERSLLQFDARADGVALGESDVVVADLGNTRGYRADVREDAGWVSIVHHGANGSADEEIYNATLGEVRLQKGDTTLLYQAGGVWRMDGNGSTMVSPPTFYYRDQTLTFPVVRVEGSGSAMGNVKAVVRNTEPRGVPVFPNASATYGDVPDGNPYENTIQHGHVTVTVHANNYRAWARYWDAYTTGTVSVDDATQTANLDFFAYGALGKFDIPANGDPIQIRGFPGDHAYENFTVVLAPDDTDAAQFDNLQWSLYIEEGGREMEVHLRQKGRAPGGNGQCKIQKVSATVFYKEPGQTTYQGWHNDDAFTTHCIDRDGDGRFDETQLVANLTSDTPVSVVSQISSNDKLHAQLQGLTAQQQFEFTGHDVAGEPAAFGVHGGPDRDTQAPLGFVVEHYFSEFGPDYDIYWGDQHSNSVNESASWGYADYPAEGRITYLHVTENNVTVDLEGP